MKLSLSLLLCSCFPVFIHAQEASSLRLETFDFWSIQEVYEERQAENPSFELKDLVAELRQDAQLTPSEKQTVTLLELLQLGRGLAWRPELDLEREMMQASVQELADQLEPTGSEMYAAAEEALYLSKLPQDSYSSNEEWFHHLQKAFAFWAKSEDLEKARRRYIAMAKDIPIRNGGRYQRRSGTREAEIARALRGYVRSALTLADTPDDKAQLHWKLAQLLRATGLVDSGGFKDLTEKHFDQALEEAPAEAEYRRILLAEAISFHISAGDDHYLRAVELIDQYLAMFGSEKFGFGQEIMSMREQIVSEKVIINAPQVVHPDRQEFISIQSRNLGHLQVRIHPLTPDLYLADLVDADPPQNPIADPAWQQNFSLEPEAKHAVCTSTIEVPTSLQPGFYRLYAGSENTWETRNLIVSRINLLIQNLEDKALVMACDSLTGAPVENCKVMLRYIAQKPRDKSRGNRPSPSKKNTLNQRIETSMEATTGIDGIAWFTFGGKKYSSGNLIATALGKQPACVDSGNYTRVNSSFPQKDTFTLFCFADQPAYRPGDTMNWKGILRSYSDGALSVPKSLKMAYHIYDEDGNIHKSGETTTNQFGTVEGSYPIPEACRLGHWSIRFEAKESFIQGNLGFLVEEYRLPEFSASLKLQEGPVKMGQTISGSITATYYSGEPIPGASVVLKIMAHQNPRSQGAYDDREPTEQLIREETLFTNMNGIAAFSFEAGYSENFAIRYQIDAEVTDLANRVSELKENLWVYPYAYDVNLTPEHTIIDQGEVLSVHICSRTTRNKHVSLKGMLEVARRVSSPPGYDLESTYTATIETDENGHATVQVPGLISGEYEFNFTSPDSRSHSERTVLAGTPEGVFGHADIEQVIDIYSPDPCSQNHRYDRTIQHEGNATIPYAIISPGNARNALVVVNDHNSFKYVSLVSLVKPVTRLELDLDNAANRQAVVSISGFADNEKFYKWKGINLKIPWKPLKLAIERTKQGPAIPGSKQKLDIFVQRGDGSPADNIEVSVSVYDDALSIYGRQPELDRLTPSHFVKSFGFTQPVSGYHDYAGYPNRLTSLTINTPYWNNNYWGGGGGDEVFELSPFEVSAVSDMEAPGFPSFDAGYISESNAGSRVFSSLHSELGEDGLSPVTFRKDLRKSAFWKGSMLTDDKGHLQVNFILPESLTRWRVEATAAAGDPEVGSGEATFTASLPVTGRLALPRFLVVGDEADLSIIAANYTKEAQEILNEIQIDEHLAGDTAKKTLTLAPDASSRSDWRVKAVAPGSSTVTSAVFSDVFSDGIERSLEVIEHGFRQRILRRDTVTNDSTRFKFKMPKRITPDSDSMEITIEAGLSPVILRALPYLIDYPHGCTEQTISRLVPVWLLKERLASILGNPSQASEAVGFESPDAFEIFLNKNLRHLDELQDHGAWGWFNSRHPDDYMTAYALWGLSFLTEAGIDIEEHFDLDETINYLVSALDKYTLDQDMQLWLIYVFSKVERGRSRNGSLDDLPDFIKRFHASARNLKPAALSWLIMTLDMNGLSSEAHQLMPLLYKKATQAKEPGTGVQTAHWGRNPERYHTWHTHPVEATAWAIMAIQQMDPESLLLEPAVNWLISERSSGQWESTRSTMIALMALESVRNNQEKPDGTSEVTIKANGRTIGGHCLDSTQLDPVHLSVPMESLNKRTNTLEVHADGPLPVRVQAELSYFEIGRFIPATVSGIRVSRSYYRVSRFPTLLTGPRIVHSLLKDGDQVVAGEEILVRMVIETSEDLHYLMIEDAKPAGFESLEIASGYGDPIREIIKAALLEDTVYSGRERWIQVEPRDQKRTSFIDQLPQGIWELRFVYRAETPGIFQALPALVEPMYYPSVRGTSAENKIGIERGPSN